MTDSRGTRREDVYVEVPAIGDVLIRRHAAESMRERGVTVERLVAALAADPAATRAAIARAKERRTTHWWRPSFRVSLGDLDLVVAARPGEGLDPRRDLIIVTVIPAEMRDHRHSTWAVKHDTEQRV